MERATLTVIACAAVIFAAASCARTESERQPAPGDQGGRATVLYQDRVVELERTLNDPNDLWVVPQDLPRINDFVLKPEGACLAELCIPVRQDRDSEMFVTRAGQGWFNVTELARKLQQAFAVDHEHARLELRQHPGDAQRLPPVGDGARFRASGSRRQAGATVGFQGEEGPGHHLGLLVRLPL